MEKGIKKSEILFLSLIILIGVFLRLNLFLQNQSFWFDESALAYSVMTLNYGELFDVLHLQQVAPPLFLVISKFITSLCGTSEYVFRLVPFLFGICSFIPFYYLLKKIFNDKTSAINFGMFLFAINPKLIYFTSEFKPYILDVFFAIIIFLAFLYIDLKNWSWKKILVTGVGLSLSVWFSFTSIILVIVGFITLLISQKEYKKFLILILPFILNTVGFFIYYLKIFNVYGDFILNLFSSEFSHFTIPISYFFNNGTPFAILVSSISLAIGILYFMIEKKKFEISFIMWAFIAVVVLSQLHLYPAYQRFMIFLLPYTIIIFAMLVSFLLERKTFQARLVFVIIFLALLPTSFMYKHSEARELTQYFLDNLNADDIVVVDNLSLPDFLFYTYDEVMDNKIVSSFEEKNNRILYKNDKYFELNKSLDKYWLYITKRKDVEKLIQVENNLELIGNYSVINKKITKNGAILKLSKRASDSVETEY